MLAKQSRLEVGLKCCLLYRDSLIRAGLYARSQMKSILRLQFITRVPACSLKRKCQAIFIKNV